MKDTDAFCDRVAVFVGPVVGRVDDDLLSCFQGRVCSVIALQALQEVDAARRVIDSDAVEVRTIGAAFLGPGNSRRSQQRSRRGELLQAVDALFTVGIEQIDAVVNRIDAEGGRPIGPVEGREFGRGWNRFGVFAPGGELPEGVGAGARCSRDGDGRRGHSHCQHDRHRARHSNQSSKRLPETHASPCLSQRPWMAVMLATLSRKDVNIKRTLCDHPLNAPRGGPGCKSPDRPSRRPEGLAIAGSTQSRLLNR